MKTVRMLHSTTDTVTGFVEHLASKDAGCKARAGLSYSKMQQGMNGQKRKVKTTIRKLENGAYEVCFTQEPNEYLMRYLWEDCGENKVKLTYEEEVHTKGLMNTLNQKLGNVLFGHTARKQIWGRLDAFEAGLEEYACQD